MPTPKRSSSLRRHRSRENDVLLWPDRAKAGEIEHEVLTLKTLPGGEEDAWVLTLRILPGGQWDRGSMETVSLERRILSPAEASRLRACG